MNCTNSGGLKCRRTGTAFSLPSAHEIWFQPGCLWPILTHLQLTSLIAELTVEFHSGGGFIHQVTCQLQKSCSWSLSKDQLCYVSTSVPNTGVNVGTFGALKHSAACLRCFGVPLCSSGKEVTEANVFATVIAAGGNSTVVVTLCWAVSASGWAICCDFFRAERGENQSNCRRKIWWKGEVAVF